MAGRLTRHRGGPPSSYYGSSEAVDDAGRPYGSDVAKEESVLYSEYSCLKLERNGPVGWLINNRPGQLNAMNAKMRDEFAQAWIELDDDPDVRVIVHTGEGRAFQTGGDVTA